MRARTLLGGLVLSCASIFGCASSDDHQVIPPVVLGMVETTAPTYDDGQVQIYEVYIPVELPLRRATDEERPQGNVDPYPRAPFHLAPDTRVTARYIVSNLENKENVVELLVDPWNEFVRYRPGVVVGDEMTSPNFSGIMRSFILPPMARKEGIITPDDMVELAVDLATAMKIDRNPPADDSQLAGPALFNRAFNIQNRSSEPDPVLGPFIPKVIAGITGFDLGLRSYAPAKVAVEVILDVEDLNGDRVIPQGEDTRRVGRPGRTLTPPPPPARN